MAQKKKVIATVVDLQLKSYMNEYWVFPSIQETPPNASLINHSCYWKSVEKC